MRCRKHPIDLSSTAGVCASCLRESLFAIMAVQAHRKSDIQQQLPPLPFSFPRSVSPYISRRKSDTDTMSTWQIHGQQQRFYSTPQVGSTIEIINKKKKKKRNGGGRLSSLFFGLFRSKSELNSNPVDSFSASSPSWFSTVVLRKKQIRTFTLDERITVEKQQRRICGDRDRGMSPAMYPDEDDDCGSSGYSSESSQGWKLTPRRTPATMRKSGVKAMGGVSGLAFCLSPLVRASPNRQWNQKGLPPEMVDYRAPSKPYISTTSSFCKNRSRKLADFGRYKFNPN